MQQKRAPSESCTTASGSEPAKKLGAQLIITTGKQPNEIKIPSNCEVPQNWREYGSYCFAKSVEQYLKWKKDQFNANHPSKFRAFTSIVELLTKRILMNLRPMYAFCRATDTCPIGWKVSLIAALASLEKENKQLVCLSLSGPKQLHRPFKWRLFF